MGSTLYVVDTDYRTDIMEPYEGPPLERTRFMETVASILPDEACHWPIISIGIGGGDEEIIRYLMSVTEYSIGHLSGGSPEDRAEVLDNLIRGEHEVAQRLNLGAPIRVGHMIDTTSNNPHTYGYYDLVYEMLRRDYGYEIVRFNINRKDVEEGGIVLEEVDKMPGGMNPN